MTIRRYGNLVAATLLTSFLSAPAMADADVGAYLAARQAMGSGDYDVASDYFRRALISDPTNRALMENSLVAMVADGDFVSAGVIAESVIEIGQETELALIAATVSRANKGQWTKIINGLEAGLTINPFIDSALQGWAALGTGDMTAALEDFDAMIEDASLRSFGLYQKALALAFVGDFEGAEALFATLDAEGAPVNVRSAIARAQILSQLDRNDDAIAVIDALDPLGTDLALAHVRETLAAGDSLPYTFVNNPAAGAAEAFLLISILLEDEASPTYGLVYARAAQALAPANSDAILRTATLLEQIGRFEMAGEVYALVKPDDPNFLGAELGRAEALNRAGKNETAIEVMLQLSRTYTQVSFVHGTLGDYLRRDGQYERAEQAYTTALSVVPEGLQTEWFLYYTRGITRERQGKWDEAEADFRKALELEPNRASVLNYLGYSLVERREKLDEALELIQRAVDLQPDNGAIVDSLGWVYYRLGQFEEAAPLLERAAALEPIDPIINDHLGDAFWMVGRKTEARFQWQRALSFDPEEAEIDRIRRKLEVGLDVVLEEENATPTDTDANGNN